MNKKLYIKPATKKVVLSLRQTVLGDDEVINFNSVEQVSGGEVGAKDGEFYDDNSVYEGFATSRSVWDE